MNQKPRTPQFVPLEPDEQVYAIKTWRYLRLAIVGIVIGLGAAVVYERVVTDRDCWQTSISAYYYTPAQAFFVGALVSIGVCLFCLRGNRDVEDTLLNLAGMCAPVVALVPTPDAGDCASIARTVTKPELNVNNNVTALLIVGLAAAITLGILSLVHKPRRSALIGFGTAVAIYLAAVVWFLAWPDGFVQNAHYTAAVLMFSCIVLVVWSTAIERRKKKGWSWVTKFYFAIGAAMVASVLLIGVAGKLGWHHWLLVLEISLIALFAAFWVNQTVDLWHRGVR
jgi:hypothetical protein